MGRFRSLVLATVPLAGVLLFAHPASAHDLRLKVDTQREPIVVFAWFEGDDTPADGASVTITSQSGEVIASGTTDERGMWSFARPGTGGSFTATVESIGHRDVVLFPLEPSGSGGEYSGWRLHKWLGAAIGLMLLLGGSAAYWCFRRKRTSKSLKTTPDVKESK